MSAKKNTEKKPARNVIKFTTRPNAFKNAKEAGERFGFVIPNGTLDEEAFIDKMVANGCKLGRKDIKYFMNAIVEVVVDVMKESPCSVDLGFCTLRPVIKGAFDSEDASFDPKRHKLVIEATPSLELKRALAKGLKAVNVTPVEAPPPAIDSVCQPPDYARNTISVTAPFEIHGTGLTVERGDESAELELPSGVRAPVALKRQAKSDGSRRVKAELAEPLPSPLPRRAWLVLRTHGLGGANSPLLTVKSAVLKLMQ